MIKSLMQNNLVGNQSSSNRTNKNSTSISIEQDLSSIFRQIVVETPRSLAEEFGVEFQEGESETKKIGFINKDSFVIRRTITLEELTSVIEHISELEKKEDAFALNYLVLAKKKNLKNSDLYCKMVDDFARHDHSRFILIGDDYEQYYSIASEYTVRNEKGDVVLLQQTPITLKDVFDRIQCEDEKIPKQIIECMLKGWTVSTQDNSGNYILYPVRILDAIQGFIEYGDNGTPCYWFNCEWFVFDIQYEGLLNSEYVDFFSHNATVSEKLKSDWALGNQTKSEEEYNKWLASKTNDRIIVTHKATISNVEIADAIFWDDSNIYLMHNKYAFNGCGARDLNNQIQMAAEYLQRKRMGYDFADFLRQYYEVIAKEAKTYTRHFFVSKQDFIELFQSGRKIVFVAGYIKDFKQSSQSTYAKYLSIETKKRLTSKGMEYCVIPLN